MSIKSNVRVEGLKCTNTHAFVKNKTDLVNESGKPWGWDQGQQ